jgi:hypothetical protein
MIYMHLLIWVGFGLLEYVPNTLYTRGVRERRIKWHLSISFMDVVND